MVCRLFSRAARVLPGQTDRGVVVVIGLRGEWNRKAGQGLEHMFSWARAGPDNTRNRASSGHPSVVDNACG